MMINAEYIYDTLIGLFFGAVDFAKWLVKPYRFNVFGVANITFIPIMVLSIGVFTWVFFLHVYHLVKPI